MSRIALGAVSADRETTGANALRLIGNALWFIFIATTHLYFRVVSCGFVSFRGRKIDFERFIGSRCGVILVRTVSDGHVGSVPMAGQVGDLETACAVSLTVSCCLRQPRIASGGTLSFA